jgi:hypothetical protein
LPLRWLEKVGDRMVQVARYSELSAGRRRRLLIVALLRSLGIAVVLFVAYFLIPMDKNGRASALWVLLIVVLAVVALIVWQTRSILTAQFPYIQAVEALACIIPLFIVGFATVYFLLSDTSTANFNVPLTRLDSLYFVVTVLSTVGFGDIVGRSEPARAIVMIQIVCDLLLIAFGLKVLSGAVRRNQSRRTAEIPTSELSGGDRPTS